MKAETLSQILSQIEIKKTFSTEVPEELIPSKGDGWYLVHEYIIKARYIDLKRNEFKDFLYQNVRRYLPISQKELQLKEIESKKIGYGLILEKLKFKKKKQLYILRDRLLYRVYIINDPKGIIENIVDIALAKIVKTLEMNPKIKVRSIVMNNIAQIIIYFDPVENLALSSLKKEYKIRIGNDTFVMPVTFLREWKPAKEYYVGVLIDAEDFNRFIRFLLYHMYKSKD